MTNDSLRLFAGSIRERVSALDAAVSFGLEPGRDGRCNCVFCSGSRKDTLRLYPGNRGFYCFRCHESGDVIKLTQKITGCSYVESMRMLNIRFNLGLELRNPNQNDLRKMREESEKRQREREQKRQEHLQNLERYWDISDRLEQLKQTRDMTEPVDREAPFPEEWCEAVREIEKLSYERDCLEYDINTREW